MSTKKIISITALVVISGLMLYGFVLINQIFSDNTKFTEKEVFVYVPTDANYDQAISLVSPYVVNMDRFTMVAGKMSYPANVKSGRFLLKKGMNSYELVKAMRSNVPVKLAFNNQERIENLAGRVGSQIEADSVSLVNAFKDSIFLKKMVLMKITLWLCLFLIHMKRIGTHRLLSLEIR